MGIPSARRRRVRPRRSRSPKHSGCKPFARQFLGSPVNLWINLPAMQTVDGSTDRRLHSLTRGFDYDSGSSRPPQNQPGSGQAVHRFRPAGLSRGLMFGRLIIAGTSGRMPAEPAGWKPALHPVPGSASWRENSPFGFAPNVQRRRAGILPAGCRGFQPRVNVRSSDHCRNFGQDARRTGRPGCLPYIPYDMNASIAWRAAL
jgi:hypothetical protein